VDEVSFRRSCLKDMNDIKILCENFQSKWKPIFFVEIHIYTVSLTYKSHFIFKHVFARCQNIVTEYTLFHVHVLHVPYMHSNENIAFTWRIK
jgi:hypothetical protein